jgi:serine/threonine protein kinase
MKPDNVLMKRDGSLCLCDFGEAVITVRVCRVCVVCACACVCVRMRACVCVRVACRRMCTVRMDNASVLSDAVGVWRGQEDPGWVVDLRRGDSPGGNPFCLCPEAKTALLPLLRGRTVSVPYAGQHVFECGVMWSYISFGQHPLPGYPDLFLTPPPSVTMQYTEASMTGIPSDDGVLFVACCDTALASDYPCVAQFVHSLFVAAVHWSPVAFRRLLRRMLSCDPAARPPLQQCLDELRAIGDTGSGAVIDALKARVRELEAQLVSDDSCTDVHSMLQGWCTDIPWFNSCWPWYVRLAVNWHFGTHRRPRISFALGWYDVDRYCPRFLSRRRFHAVVSMCARLNAMPP